QYAADHLIDGKFDEFRVSKTPRTAGWITTAYNNQNAPSTFYTASAVYSATTLCTLLPIELIEFNAHAEANSVLLDWSTGSEMNNDHFAIERSTDATNWVELGSLQGAGNHVGLLRYTYEDDAPLSGTNYYRLRQVDFDGTFTMSNVRAVDMQGASDIVLWPNPVHDHVQFMGAGNVPVRILDSAGRIVAQGWSAQPLDLTDLSDGTYVAQVQYGESRKTIPLIIVHE
ncbi:MAG TPA: T9SS type A sorting domain-containing protein, partial [Flavobacteriales bacterium]|nr:T9SS type A sorting domain-containing protein [Flavobacteriales bacterium]